MKLGLGSYTFRWSIGHKGLNPPRPMTAFDLLGVAREHRLAVVQYADNLPLHTLPEADLDRLAAAAREAGIALELGCQGFDENVVRRYIGIGRRIDAGILRVALDGPDAAKPVPDLAAAFHRLIPEARAAGLRIAIENHFNYPSPRMVQLLAAVDDPDLGVCLDVANSICAGEWPAETVGLLAPRAINLHLKDYVIVPDPYGVGFVIHGCPMGQGRCDGPAVLAAVAHQPEMSVLYEHWLPREDDMEAARAKEHAWLEESLDYMRTTLAF
ncbi:sugar phosphate isomerase/epimerase family protein [Wenxinia marina]|uniref:Sugar phosphate isomerase/epimerase n=1 Tax=Wenxinia marina DSM 24838 TaxID=1123501 RepID=A0A0D0PC27_9RHOB|nr:sugar phosphate isomerase/epimerase [Wenxinia marina]KIQ69016.1 Sugar phosphate isomerase/epimerase [Wenxinia marina DSM 24838]GGL81158.1 endonuclease [Wenxinia marina]